MCFPLEYFVKGNVIYQVDIPSLVRTSGLLAANCLQVCNMRNFEIVNCQPALSL